MNWKRLRFRVGSFVMGDNWAGVVTRLWLIRDRALAAVSKDGMVTLAECPALAEALYERMPGKWALSVARIDAPREPLCKCGHRREYHAADRCARIVRDSPPWFCENKCKGYEPEGAPTPAATTHQVSCNVAGCNGRCGICRLPELPEIPPPPNPPFPDRGGSIASEEARRASPHRFESPAQ